MAFEFHAVVDRLEDVWLWMPHVSNKDLKAVGVNLALQLHGTLYDSSKSAIRDFLTKVRSANPTVVVVAEQESDHYGDEIANLVGGVRRHGFWRSRAGETGLLLASFFFQF